MYIRLSIPEYAINHQMLSDIQYVFGDKIDIYFEKKKDKYFYKYPVDITVNEEHIEKLIKLNYVVTFSNNIMEIKCK
jgi:hypothetical protein